MSLSKNLNCWEIIECKESANCQAKQFPDVPCWEIEQVCNNRHSILDVCLECIVYIVKADEPVLTESELLEIAQYREVMKFVQKCPVYDNNIHQYEDSLA